MDGSTLGAAIALIKKNKPTDEQIESAVDNWLDDHPEATTTVQDGSITKAKLDSNLQGTVDEVDDLKDIVAIQSTQPTYSDNKIWIDTTNTPTGIEVPTYTELTDLMNAIDDLPTDETAQELLTYEEMNAGLTDTALAVIGLTFQNLPQDDTATDILNSLSLECERLQAIYDNWLSERSA